MSDSSRRTIIENGSEFEGSVHSECAVAVGGSLKGSVSAPALTVTPSGAVHGRVSVSELRSLGEISGEIEAGAVELAGIVGDDTTVRAGTLEVKLSQPQGGGMQVTFGNCELVVGGKPAIGRAEPSTAQQPEAVPEEELETESEAEPAV